MLIAEHRLHFWCVSPSHPHPIFTQLLSCSQRTFGAKPSARRDKECWTAMSEKLRKELSFEVQSNKVETVPLFLREWMDHENVDD